MSTRSEVLIFFGNLSGSAQGSDKKLFRQLLDTKLLSALVQEMTDHTPNKRTRCDQSQYQMIQLQFLTHMFKTYHGLVNQFANTYDLDCLATFEYSESVEVNRLYTEFVLEFFDVQEDENMEDLHLGSGAEQGSALCQ